jgi:hypothetical protein
MRDYLLFDLNDEARIIDSWTISNERAKIIIFWTRFLEYDNWSIYAIDLQYHPFLL